MSVPVISVFENIFFYFQHYKLNVKDILIEV